MPDTRPPPGRVIPPAHAAPPARVEWIDICKGLGIVFVVLGHNSVLVATAPALYQTIFLFHVPLFFFVSGLTLKPEAPFAAQWRRIGALVVPYFVLSALMLPVFLRDSAQAGVALKNFALGSVYGTGFTMYYMPLWFLPCLAVGLVIVGLVVAPFVKSLGDARRARAATWVLAAIAFALLLAGGWVMQHSHGHLVAHVGWGSLQASGPFWSLDVAPVAAGFILLGALSAKWLVSSGQRAPSQGPWAPVGITLLGVALLALAEYRGVRTDLNMRVFAPAWHNAALAFVGIMMAISLSRLIERVVWLKRPFLWAGQSSLVVLWLHGVVQHKSVQVFAHALGGAPLWIASALVAVAVPVLVDQLLVRRFAIARALIYPKFGSLSTAKKAAKKVGDSSAAG